MEHEKAMLAEAARERMAAIEQAMADAPEDAHFIRVDVKMSRPSAAAFYEELKQIVEGGPVDYDKLLDSLTLGIIANSSGWRHLRRCLRIAKHASER